MGFFGPVTLEGSHASLVPLSHDHHDGLCEATRDGELWTLWYTLVPSPEGMKAWRLSRLRVFDLAETERTEAVEAERAARRLEEACGQLAKALPPGAIDTAPGVTLAVLMQAAASVEQHGRRIAPRLGSNHLGTSALPPDFELLDRRRPEGITRTQQNRLPLGPQELGKLSNRRCLAGPVYPYHQHDFRHALFPFHGRYLCVVQNCEKFLFEQPFEFVHVSDLLAISFLAQMFEHLMSRRRSQVRTEEGGF